MHSNSVYANTFYTVNNFDEENEVFDVSDCSYESSAIIDEDEQVIPADNENSAINESVEQELPADNVHSSINLSVEQELPIYALPEPPELKAKPTKPQYFVLTSKASIAAKKKIVDEKQAAVIAREKRLKMLKVKKIMKEDEKAAKKAEDLLKNNELKAAKAAKKVADALLKAQARESRKKITLAKKNEIISWCLLIIFIT